jgi:hypothetical protein
MTTTRRCDFCIHVRNIDGVFECRRSAPTMTDLRGYAMWPNVEAYDSCSEFQVQSVAADPEKDYLRNTP